MQTQVVGSIHNQVQRARSEIVGMLRQQKVEINPEDLIVNVNEADLAGEIEALAEIDGKLDGLLSLMNAKTLLDL